MVEMIVSTVTAADADRAALQGSPRESVGVSLLAQAPGVGDNKVLDQWTIPFGEWVKQMVGWIDQNLGLLLSIIEWPFTWLFRNLVRGGDYHPWWQLEDMPWIAVCAGFFIIGTRHPQRKGRLRSGVGPGRLRAAGE